MCVLDKIVNRIRTNHCYNPTKKRCMDKHMATRPTRKSKYTTKEKKLAESRNDEVKNAKMCMATSSIIN